MGPQRNSLPPEGVHDFLEDHPFEIIKHPLPHTILVEEAMIPMRDGIKLAATIFRPNSGPRVPVITTATPYGKDNYDQWNLFQDPPKGVVPHGGFYMGRLRISDRTPFEAPDPGFWVPNGYAVVIVDLPGRGKSESNPATTPGPESRWWDIMEWLAAQRWCSGKIGMAGAGVLSSTQWLAAKGVAGRAPPQLKAIIPWEGVNESGPGGGFGGIPERGFIHWMVSQWLRPNINPESKGVESLTRGWEFDTAAIKVPALICASFSDQEYSSWDSFDAFTRLQSKDKWLISHRRQKWGAFYGREEVALQKRFFDRFLKGEAHAMDGVPRVQLEVNWNRFDYKIIEANTWPVEGLRYEPLYLDARTKKLEKSPIPMRSTIAFNPSAVEDVKNRAVFDYVVPLDTDIIGYMSLKLFIEAVDTDDVDLFVGIEKLDRNGNEVYFFSSAGGNANGPVSRGWLRASWRQLDMERSNKWRPVLSMKDKELLSHGEIVEVDIAIMPSGTTFLGGETLRLVVQSWSGPGQWEGGIQREWDTLKRGRCRLHTGQKFASRLLIPTLEN